MSDKILDMVETRPPVHLLHSLPSSVHSFQLQYADSCANPLYKQPCPRHRLPFLFPHSLPVSSHNRRSFCATHVYTSADSSYYYLCTHLSDNPISAFHREVVLAHAHHDQ